MSNTTVIQSPIKRKSFMGRLWDDLKRNKVCYLMVLPVMLFFILFHYVPMYGAIIAFMDYTPAGGFWGSEWVGLEHFREFFTGPYFWRTLKNTLIISITTLCVGFPAPIVLALLLNEIRSKTFAKIVQTTSYLPHFISLVVICGMIKDFTMDDGIINTIIAFFGGKRVSMLIHPEYFVPVYAISNIWEGMGWGSIVYLAALSAVDQSLYEAATVDGAGRFRQVFAVTLPGIAPTIITMLLLRIGAILSVGYEKIILLWNDATRDTADVISTFVYEKGLKEQEWSFSSAVGLFNSVINLLLLVIANKVSAKVSDTALW